MDIAESHVVRFEFKWIKKGSTSEEKFASLYTRGRPNLSSFSFTLQNIFDNFFFKNTLYPTFFLSPNLSETFSKV